MSTEQTIKLGIVGLSTRGWAATTHSPALFHPSLRSTYSLTALQTSSEATAAAAKELYAPKLAPGATLQAYHGEDATALANDPNVDVVGVMVKAPNHKAVFDAAVAVGKHIFVEYPPGRTWAESMEMRRAVAKQGNIQAAVGLQAIQSSAIRKVKQIIDSGKLGRIVSTTATGFMPRETRFLHPEVSASQAYTLDMSNGVTLLSIAGGHHLSDLIHLLGAIASISATGATQFPTTDVYSEQFGGELLKTVKSETFDHYTIAATLQSGVHASIVWRSGVKSTPGRLGLLWVIDGEEGSIKFNSDVSMPTGSLMNIADPKVTVNGQPLDEYFAAEGFEYSDPGLVVEEGEQATTVEFVRREWVEFAKALRGGKGGYATLDDAIEVQRVVEAIERSAELSGLTVKLA